MRIFGRLRSQLHNSFRRHERESLFAEHVLDGPLLDISGNHAQERDFWLACDIERLCITICDQLNQSAPKISNRTRFYFGFIDTPILGGWAYDCGEGQYAIAISVGTYHRLRSLFYVLTLTGAFNQPYLVDKGGGLVGPDTYGFVSEEYRFEGSHVAHILPRDRTMEASDENFRYVRNIRLRWRNERQEFEADLLVALSLAYLFWHELGHIVGGHFTADVPRKRFSERPDSNEEPSRHVVLHHGYELLADHYAALILATNAPLFSFPPATPKESKHLCAIDYLGALHPVPQGEQFLYLAAYAALTTLVALDQNRNIVSDYRRCTHPHPELRYSTMIESGLLLAHSGDYSPCIDDPREWYRSDAVAWSAEDNTPLACAWRIAWSRAGYDLACSLPTVGIPNVLNWSARSADTVFAEERRSAKAALHDAWKTALPHLKKALCLGAYCDVELLPRLPLPLVRGVDIPENPHDRPRAHIGLFNEHDGRDLQESLQKEFDSQSIISFSYRDLCESDAVSPYTLLDLMEQDRDSFLRRCDHIVTTADGAPGMSFFLPACEALRKGVIRSLFVVSNSVLLLDLLEKSFHEAEYNELLVHYREGTLLIMPPTSTDVIAQTVATAVRKLSDRGNGVS